MSKISLSRAWEETRGILAHDGRLFASVALALVALPSIVMGLINPTGVRTGSTPMWINLVALIGSLVVLTGQLAMIRLALGPRITVGGAISQGARRMPAYFVAILLIVLGLLIAAIPFGAVLALAGVPLDRSTDVQISPAIVLAILLYVALALYIAIRLIFAAPACVGEEAGIIGMMRRSWALTAGQWWRLFGFVIAFFVGTLVAVVAITTAAGAVAGLAFGPIEPMSASALLVALVESLVSATVTVIFTVMLARMYAQAAAGEAQASVPSSGI